MTTPTITYTTINGVRVASVDGGRKLPTNNTVAPAGTHDIKSLNGNIKISIGGNLHEPLDVAAMLNKI